MNTNNAASRVFSSLEEAEKNPQKGRGDSAWKIHVLSLAGKTWYVWSGSMVCAKADIFDLLGGGASTVSAKDAALRNAEAARAKAEQEKKDAEAARAKAEQDVENMKRAYAELQAAMAAKNGHSCVKAS